MIVRSQADGGATATRAGPSGSVSVSKSPLASPREPKSPATSPRPTGNAAAASASLRPAATSPRPVPATVAHLMILDKRSDFIGPFVDEYEVMDKKTGKLAWLTEEDMDARLGAGAAEHLLSCYALNPPPKRERKEIVVPEEKKPAPTPTPTPATPAPAPAVAAAPAKPKGILDKLDSAINRKLGGGGGSSAPSSPRRQVPPLDLASRQHAADEGARKSPRGEDLVDLPRSATNSPRPAPAASSTAGSSSPRPGAGNSPRPVANATSPRPAASVGQTALTASGDKTAAMPLDKKTTEKKSDAVPATAGAPAPEVRSPKAGQSIVERMRTLKELFQSGLIEAEEYEAKRKQILDSL